MKKKILFALLGVVAMLTSCSKDGTGSLATYKAISFNVSVDDGVQTRANVEDLTRYILEVYNGATATGTPVTHIEQATGTFTNVQLLDKQQYTILFWADYGTPSTDGTNAADNEYNASDLKAAQVATGKQPTRAAYSSVKQFTVGTDDLSTYTSVQLTHAVAQVNFVQTEALVATTNTLKVSYPESYSINISTNVVTKIDGVITHSFPYNKTEKGTLGTSYIIAAQGTPRIIMDITTVLNDETEKVITSVPCERNFKTNISGSYSNKYVAGLTVTCDDKWGTTDNEVNGKSYKVGDFYPNDTNPIGVVFFVDGGKRTGKIISFKQERGMKWSTEYVATGATDEADGAANTAKIFALGTYSEAAYPAFVMCATQNTPEVAGIKWYVPSILEMESIYINRDILNVNLSKISGASIPKGGISFMSSTEHENGSVYTLEFDGSKTTKDKALDGFHYCRTVSSFCEFTNL